MFEFVLYSGVATAAKIGTVYPARRLLSRFFGIPFLGWIGSFAFGGLMDWILLKLFSFRSSIAGVANLTSSLVFAWWMHIENKKRKAEMGLA